MSMVGNVRSAPDADIDALLERPRRVVKFLYDEEAEEGWAQTGGFGSLFRRKDKADAEPDTWTPTGEGEELYLDKTWHGIHYLLTGTEWAGDPPLDFIVKSGREIGNVDVGYGPARALHSQQVQAIAAALVPLPPDTIAERYDEAQMTRLKIYPEIWDRSLDPEDDDDPLGYLIEYYTELRDFVQQAAERGHGLIVYIN